METQLTLKLFGALRKYGENSMIELQLPKFASVSDLKAVLETYIDGQHPGFKNSGILAECAFATEDRVLAENEAIPETKMIAVLPPVCGG
jgi:molybdopterin converting factor small subunit